MWRQHSWFLVFNHGEKAFSCCTGLENVDLSGCTSLKSIGEWVFFMCKKLKRVYLPNREEIEIGERAFSACAELWEIDLEN